MNFLNRSVDSAYFFYFFPCYFKMKSIKDLSMSEDSWPLGQFY